MNSNIGLTIKHLAEKKYHNSAEFARLIGKTPQNLNKLFSTKNPGAATLSKVSEVLGVPLDYILNYDISHQSKVEEMATPDGGNNLYPPDSFKEEETELDKNLARIQGYERLFELKQKGVLTEEEFIIEKTRLLNS